jgi:hypothetical protein
LEHVTAAEAAGRSASDEGRENSGDLHVDGLDSKT